MSFDENSFLQGIGVGLAISRKKMDRPYIYFESPQSFTLNTYLNTKNWNGTLEYSTDALNWTTWDGTTVLSSGAKNRLYLRGTGNTIICYYYSAVHGNMPDLARWVLTGTDISAYGNIENLLDWRIASRGGHPTMRYDCFSYLFSGCTSLIKAPTLPSPVAPGDCYSYMFQNCTGLIEAPELPATTLGSYCYASMFSGCTALTKAPSKIEASMVYHYACQWMFAGCTSLTTPPILLADTILAGGYNGMFGGCIALETAPALPAKAVYDDGYRSMFYGCTSLTTPPALPATTLGAYCYAYMFSGCTNLIFLPELPAMVLATYCYNRMFEDCKKIKIYKTEGEDHTIPYRVPSSGTGTSAFQALLAMFMSTGGSNIGGNGTISINTTYYTSNNIIPAT